MRRLAALVLLAALLFVLVHGCAPDRPSCLPAESSFSAAVAVECRGYEFDECPAMPALKAKRAADERALGCR